MTMADWRNRISPLGTAAAVCCHQGCEQGCAEVIGGHVVANRALELGG
jgi:hypothetical protein